LTPHAGSVGDELGSALIGSRLVRDIMSLCFLMEKRYAPYAKWFGTAFQRLECAPQLSPLLWKAHQASSWKDREQALSAAHEILAFMYNNMGIGRKLPPTSSTFHGRPFQVIHGEEFAQALAEQITDAEVRDMSFAP
jgi:hypothetical protein